MASPSKAAAAVAAAYARVRERLAAAAARGGRPPESVGLVAVTKSASLDQILALVGAGHQDLAENRVQALGARITALASEPIAASVRWHMIGHLQRNKVEQVVGRVSLIHSVDSLRLAEALEAAAAKRNTPPVDVLIELNISGEASKYGLAPGDLAALAAHIATLPHLRLRGLMTMAPYSDRPEDSRPIFARCRRLFETLRADLGPSVDTLSMGMSGDFEVAVEEGATLVRIGRALFG